MLSKLMIRSSPTSSFVLMKKVSMIVIVKLPTNFHTTITSIARTAKKTTVKAPVNG